MKEAPWAMTQEWHDVIFLHWPVSAQRLKDYIPKELEIDLFNGTAWIGLVLFQAKETRLRFLPPVPGVRSYTELNVRTYVKYKERQGVYFFSLDADSLLAVKAAGAGGFLPYRQARMSMVENKGTWKFKSRRTHKGSFPETLSLDYRAATEPVHRGFLEVWLTERYCLWTKPKKNLLRVDISHSQWNLYDIEGEIRVNSMASFLPENLHAERPLAHYGGSKKVRFFPPVVEKEN